MLRLRRAGRGTARRTLTNSGWLLASTGLTGAFSIAQGVLLTRSLGVRSYGIFAVIVTFVTVVNRLTSFRMNEFVVKYVSDAVAADDRRQAAAAVKLAMLVEAAASVVAFLVVLGLAPLASRWIVKEPGTAQQVAVAGLITLGLLVAESSVGVLQAFNRFRLQSMLSAAGALLTLGCVAAAFLWDGRLPGMIWAVVAGTFASSALLTIAAGITAGQECGAGWWRVPVATLGDRSRSALRFAFSTNASATLSLITRDADVLWLNLFRNPVEVGYYRLALSLATYVSTPIAQLAQTLYPEIARKAAAFDWKAFRELLRWGTALAALYLVPVAGLLVLASRPLIRLLYGAPFLPAAPALTVLLVGVGFANLFFWSRPALLALGRADYPLKVNIGVAALKVIGIFSVIPAFGYIGTSFLLSGLYVAGVSVSVWKVRAELRERRLAARPGLSTQVPIGGS